MINDVLKIKWMHLNLKGDGNTVCIIVSAMSLVQTFACVTV